MSRWDTVPNARRCGGIAACESLGNVLMSRAVFNKRIAATRAAAEVKYSKARAQKPLSRGHFWVLVGPLRLSRYRCVKIFARLNKVTLVRKPMRHRNSSAPTLRLAK